MVPTAQNRHPRVHSWPAIMKVASPLAQQSCMFGHRASWHTVCRVLSLTAAFVLLYMACCSPDGRAVLNHGGSRSRFAFGRAAGGNRSAIGSGFPDIPLSPLVLPTPCPSKRCAVKAVSPVLLNVYQTHIRFGSERALMSNVPKGGLWRKVLRS